MKSLRLTGGRVFGGTGWNPPQWHDAILIKDGLIDCVDYIDETVTSDETISLNNSLVLPGLCDAHLHMLVGGLSQKIPDLEGLDELRITNALNNYIKSKDSSSREWVEAFNWQPRLCRLNTKTLDKIIPDRPVVIHNLDLHSCCANTLALKAAGFGSNSNGFSSDDVECDEAGKPTGILKEEAAQHLYSVIPKAGSREMEEAILNAQDYLLSHGITAISEVLQPNSNVIFRRLNDEGKLILDVDAWLRLEDREQGMRPVDYGRRFRVNTIKIFLDGSLGSRTAAMCEPYNDSPGQSGVLFYDDDELVDLLIPIVNSGWRITAHAIGDCAVKQFCRVIKRLPLVEGTNHRIEHVQVLPVEGTSQIAESGAVASIQPVHLIDDQRWLKDRIGSDRFRRNAAWRSLYSTDISLAIGSDWPVASPDPLLNLHCAINRCGFKEAPHEDNLLSEALAPHTAIRAATYGWAVAAGLEEYRGTITVGQKADLTVISGVSDDLKDWSEAKIEMTICGGKIVFS